MKIAVVGGGGREHAIVRALARSARCTELFAIPGNAGMEHEAACVPIPATDIVAVTHWCAENQIEYVVVAPDNPLALGLVDELAAAGIPAFGPTRAAARIEASKAFAKDLMRRYHIPTARYGCFESADKAMLHIEAKDPPLVVKADGLALGKGVYVCHTMDQAVAAVRDLLVDEKFGASGRRVVVEELLTGPEVSVLAFCDGETVVPMVSCMDHKRAFDGDDGPNTGGMGAVAPNPYYTPAVAQRCMQEIFLPTVRAMAAEGAPFKGCLYFGLMLTPEGPKVIEYNCRFGDPEAQVVLPLLESDFLEICLACTEGRLSPDMVRFSPGAAACVVMASGGYPASYQTGRPIKIFKEQQTGAEIFFAGVKRQGGELVTNGGRVLGVTAAAETLQQALNTAYAAVRHIQFQNAHYRTDIGRSALQAPAAGGPPR